MSVTRGQCDDRPTATFPAARHHRPLAGTKLYCLVTEAPVRVNNLPGVALDSEYGWDSNPRPVSNEHHVLTTTVDAGKKQCELYNLLP